MSRVPPILVACFLPFGAVGQTPDTAAVHGQVVDPSHAGIAGAQVAFKNRQTGFERKAQTDSTGNFAVEGLPVAGAYDVTASKPGFADAPLKQITLLGGASADLSIELNLASGQSQVVVTGVVGEIRTDEPQLGDHLTARQMEEMPLLNRRITALPMLNAANHPAISQGDIFTNQNLFTTNGAGRRQAWFEVDGSNAVDLWGRQTIFSNLPLNSLQEMTILTNAFSAEFGGTAGAVINIVTKSGGSQWHGDGLYAGRPAGTAAALSGFTTKNAASGNDISSDQLNQATLSLGGPLGSSGKTHIFGAGEYSMQDRDSPVISPVAPGVFTGYYRGWLGLLRLDRQLSDKHSLFFRSNVDGFHDTNPNGAVGGNNLPSVGRIFRRRTYSEELGETAVLGPSLINNARLQFQLASPITEFDPLINGTQYVVPISTGGTFTSGTSQSAVLMNRQYEASDVLSATWGRHQVKFGGSAVVAHTGGNGKEFGGPSYLGILTYNTCTQSLAVCESPAYLGNIANVRTYSQSFGNAVYSINDGLWALFVQDDYHLRPNLTLNLGLRYEQQTFTDSRKDFAPRAGFAYNVRGDGKTVIRGGFGIYYSQIPDNAQANYALTGPTGVFNYTAGPGQVGFPSSVSSVPLAAFPQGAQAPLRSLYLRPGDAAYYNQFFPASTLNGYPAGLYNPYSEQWSFGVERSLHSNWILSADYVGSHTLKINRPLDVNPPAPFVRTAPGQIRSAQAANCTRPYWIYWYRQAGMTCNPSSATNPQPPYALIQSDVNNGYAYYNALDVNLSHSFNRKLSLLASYTWSHAIDNVDPDVPGQNPNDANFTGKIENGNAIFDQRHRFVLSGLYELPWKICFGGIATLGSGLPYNITTGTVNSGDNGATTDRPVVNGVVIGRNAGHGRPIYEVSPFLERAFLFRREHLRLTIRAESFNVFNHANFVGYSGTYGNGAAPGLGFGTPLAGITSQLPARSLQFSGRVSF